MNNQTDAQLLRAYAENRSEPAFTELVRRHVDLIHSAALRMVCDSHLAQDVTQAVFVALAKNASQLTDRAVLCGWLHRTARNIAVQTVRTDARRRVREQEAAAMNELLSAESETSWEAIAPHLDVALGELADADRDALMLRYFEKKSALEMAGILGISDEAAQKRVSRAVDRLRELFSKRNVTIGSAGLVVLITANAVQAAPIGLVMTISTAALAGATVSTSTIIAATKTMAMTTLQKTIVTAAVAALAGAGLYEGRQAAKLNEQVQTLQREQAPLAAQLQQLQLERDEATNQFAQLREQNRRLSLDRNELLRLRGELATIQRQPTGAEQVTPAQPATGANPNQGVLPEDIGREIGTAVVRGDAGALEKLATLAKTELATFNTNSIGMDDTKKSELHDQTFGPLFSAFRVIQDAAVQGNQTAIDAVIKGVQLPELKGHAIEAVGALAGAGNNDALEVLLNYDQYNFPLASTVGALVPAADKGNQRAIDFLSAITKNENDTELWMMAADGLGQAAQSGNATAIDALIGLSGNTDPNVRRAVIDGLKKAAANNNTRASATLQAMAAQ